MKKQKLSLSKKLFLNKETIGSLNSKEASEILGGGQYTAVIYCGPATAKSCKPSYPQDCATLVVNQCTGGSL